MISLLYRIAADINPFRMAMKQVEGSASKAGADAGKAMAAQMKAAVTRFLGAGAIIGGVMKASVDAQKTIADANAMGIGVEAMQELEIAAKKTGLSISDLIERSKQAPKAFSDLMESIRAGGGIIPKETLEDLNRAGEAIDSITNSAKIAVAYVWKALTGIAKVITYGAFAGAGSAATMVGKLSGNETLTNVGREYTIRSQLGAEEILGVDQPVKKGKMESLAGKFVGESNREKEFSAWWEQIGGNEDWSKKGTSSQSDSRAQIDGLKQEIRTLRQVIDRKL